jgi:8-oxo-dGTP diphosphatase
MDSASPWTGRRACALQTALRLSNDGFASHLGVAPRTVAGWHKKPDLVPRPEMQQALDTALEQASEAARRRFAQIIGEYSHMPASGEAQAFRVAVAVVVNESDVLIVCRRGEDGGGISWQFPAGVVKPGASPETVAVRETLAETRVHCAVIRSLGSRLHPITNVMCDYLLCEYLAGDAENVDIVENVSVTWTDRRELTRFIPADRIYPPVLEALEVASD